VSFKVRQIGRDLGDLRRGKITMKAAHLAFVGEYIDILFFIYYISYIDGKSLGVF